LSFKAFAKTVDYWRLRADPDGANEDDEAKRDDRGFHLSESFGGMWFASLSLDPISGSIVAKELRRIEQAMFNDDWREAADRVGRTPTILDLERSPAQRRADALVEMATRSAAMPAGSRRPEPLFTVLVGWETLHDKVCELSNGTVVSPGSLERWLDVARLERAVFGPDSRVIDIGVSRRLFEGATRRAVQVRDHAQGCFNATCDEDPERCQVDHIIPWSAGGPTTQANGRLACSAHNRGRHGRPPP
jgi:hypothetical protein